MRTKGERVTDVFKALDSDGSGSVSRREFARGVQKLDLPFSPAAADVNAPNARGLTPLHLVAMSGGRDASPAVAHLLEAGKQ